MGLSLRVRLLLTLGLSASLIVVAASPALAWSNGVGGYNSYGTHDWVLDKALGALGADAAWVCTKTALRATDDPDSVDGLDHASGTWWHVYDIWGSSTYGDAPEAAQVWFNKAKKLHAQGKDCPASRALGIMAHLVADVSQPMHTDGSDAEDRVHSPYEEAVDSRSERTDTNYTFAFDGVDSATPYARTVRVAKLAHKYYSILVNTYDAHGYNKPVDRITKRQLNRAANAVADLIAAMS